MGRTGLRFYGFFHWRRVVFGWLLLEGAGLVFVGLLLYLAGLVFTEAENWTGLRLRIQNATVQYRLGYLHCQPLGIGRNHGAQVIRPTGRKVHHT